MSQLIVSNIVSVDGYYEGPGKDIMRLNMDAAFDAYNLERIRTAAAVLLGRKSFEMFSTYWPAVADAPADPSNLALDANNRQLSRIYNELPKVVVSDSYEVPAENPWRDTTTIIGRGDVAAFVTNARRQGRGDILTFGSPLPRANRRVCDPRAGDPVVG